MCLLKPKENKQMAYVFMHWTPNVPTISSVCDWRAVAYKSFVVWDINFHSGFCQKRSQKHMLMQLKLLAFSVQQHFPMFQTAFVLLYHIFAIQRLRQNYSHSSYARLIWFETLW